MSASVSGGRWSVGLVQISSTRCSCQCKTVYLLPEMDRFAVTGMDVNIHVAGKRLHCSTICSSTI